MENILNKIRKNNDTSKEEKNIIRLIKGSISSIIISVIFLFVYAIVLTYTTVPESTMPLVITVIIGVSILIGSSISSMQIKKNGFINGGVVGLIYMLFLYISSSMALSGFSINLNTLILIISGIVVGMIGGIIGVNIK